MDILLLFLQEMITDGIQTVRSEFVVANQHLKQGRVRERTLNRNTEHSIETLNLTTNHVLSSWEGMVFQYQDIALYFDRKSRLEVYDIRLKSDL